MQPGGSASVRAKYVGGGRLRGTARGGNEYRRGTRRNVFGDVALIVFLLAQASDGVLTYIGVSTYGLHVEGNPLIGWLMSAMGQGPALATAKLAAGFFGIALHLSSSTGPLPSSRLSTSRSRLCPGSRSCSI